MDAELILWPVVLLALVTLFVYIPMSRARVKAVKEGKVKARVFKLNQEEPEESLVFSNALRNQYETPVLFYAACLTAYVSNNASVAMIILAWVYFLAKAAHVYVHISTNNLRQRRPVFMVAYAVLWLMYLVLAGHLLKLF